MRPAPGRTRRLRVLLNVVPLRARRTGVGRCLARLVQDLERRHPEVSLGFFDGWRVGRELPRLARSGVVDGALQRALHHPALSRLYPPLQDQRFRALGAEARYDLYHETNFLLPPFGKPSVATVWDLSLRFHPEAHPAGRVRVFESAFARRLERLERVLVLSRSVAQEVEGELRISAERIAVTPPGVDRDRFHPPEAPEGAAPDGLPERFLLHAGALEPRKNLELLFAAYERLPATLRDGLGVVLAGPPGWRCAELLTRIRAAERRGHAVWLGHVPDLELARLYRRATAFVYPSVYEGFGLPVLEAMASGTPVVCSDILALRELTDGAALLVPSDDPDALADALARVLEDSALHERLSRDGPARAALYSWARFADATADAYAAAVAG